ncbi:rhodanese-like domain-containing protein [Jeongeupia naejangsanensis]|uniref:Rhodanese-like domain-containing protein n=1 Tax=Jeongeupia naejangsanensis TaxID=613195 RepID=A0ABS2BGA4_9NEIS|nr:rhodanese-like domain-containing protein [Jeongeupia naejangsanensis]MBM3114652.1 rhodanese-like domain-containing protein [Jeongeupia naejangsanensis]
MSTTALAPQTDANPETHTVSTHPLLLAARQRLDDAQLPFAGSVTPQEAWQLVEDGAARLVDVRSPEEVKFVGAVPDTLNVPWASGTALNRNPRFVKELETKAGGKDAVLLLLCRSGKRSAEAAAAASKAGFSQVFNVLEGFEGELDAQQRRGAIGGWRHHGLPWLQD